MLKVSNIAVSLDEKDYAKVIANTLNIRKSQVKNVKIARKAVDARRKNKVHFNMGFTFECANEDQLLKTHSKQVSKVKEYHYDKLTPNNQTIMVVGSGPAGLFCAYNLARSGQKVILIEQGKCVDERKKDIDTYLETGKLNVQSNVQFGEGGAGTFSDGKLTTGIKDYRKQFVLNTFYEHGANEDILYLNKPHLGTDVLINVVKNIRKDIEKCGEVRFETKLVDLIVENNQIKEVVLENKEGTYKEKVDQLVLAIGHSARNTYEMLYQKQLEISQKAFAVGMRIEHSQEFINKSQYGKFYNHPALKAADYKLAVHTSQKRGVYTFCMCPGGFVVPAASSSRQVVVNGMSPSNRGSRWANSGMVGEIRPEDYSELMKHEEMAVSKDSPLALMAFQERLEELCWLNGGMKQTAPAQRMVDFVNKKNSFDLPESSYTPGLLASPLHFWMPEFVTGRLREGFRHFGKVSRGFLTNDAVMIGVETRTSSPVRILRDKESYQHITLKGLFPCGEGAGYAGGIVSAAIDGERCAEGVAGYLSLV